jgi:hypothetical protein
VVFLGNGFVEALSYVAENLCCELTCRGFCHGAAIGPGQMYEFIGKFSNFLPAWNFQPMPHVSGVFLSHALFFLNLLALGLLHRRIAEGRPDLSLFGIRALG